MPKYHNNYANKTCIKNDGWHTTVTLWHNNALITTTIYSSLDRVVCMLSEGLYTVITNVNGELMLGEVVLDVADLCALIRDPFEVTIVKGKLFVDKNSEYNVSRLLYLQHVSMLTKRYRAVTLCKDSAMVAMRITGDDDVIYVPLCLLLTSDKIVYFDRGVKYDWKFTKQRHLLKDLRLSPGEVLIDNALILPTYQYGGYWNCSGYILPASKITLLELKLYSKRDYLLYQSTFELNDDDNLVGINCSLSYLHGPNTLPLPRELPKFLPEHVAGRLKHGDVAIKWLGSMVYFKKD